MDSGKELSVIIPVYNWDIKLLVEALAREVGNETFSEKVEILIGDDCSSPEFRNKNKDVISKYPFCRYYEQEEQLGRSGIRNFLIKESKYSYTLMLDGDMLPDSDNFLAGYLNQITSESEVICGGYSYKKRILLGKEYDFYLYKGKKTEELGADIRNKTPWRYLFTGNILVPRAILESVHFDEGFSGYGYEDIEWGIRLFSQYSIRHINNTCSHLGLVKKDVAFTRMRSSIKNFDRIRKLHPEVFGLTGAARVERYLSFLPNSLLKGLDRFLVALFKLFEVNSICFLIFQLDKAVQLALTQSKTKDR